MQFHQKVRLSHKIKLPQKIKKKRGLGVQAVSLEVFIDWNGPPVHLADSIGVASLDSYFAGRSHWRFVTKKNKLVSAVVSRLKSQKANSKMFE